MTTPTRVSIVGTGMIGNVHRRAARNAGATVIGVLASTAQKSLAVASEWGVPTGYGDIRELINSAPDFVHICTPNQSHFELAMAVIEAGINVICEKPLAMSADQAFALAAAAERQGVVATVPFVYRYHPLVRELRARRIAGEFGQILLVHGSYLQDWLLDPLATSWRVDAGAGGASRAFADIGSHWCDLASFITGERYAAVNAITSIAYPARPRPAGPSFDSVRDSTAPPLRVTTEDTAIVILKSEAGVLLNTVISQISAGRKNRLWIEVDGSKGSAVFDQEQPESVWLGSENGATVLRRGEGPMASEQQRLSIIPAGHPQGYVDAFTAFLDDSYAIGRGEVRDGVPTFEDGARSALLVDAVLSSAADSRWVPLVQPEAVSSVAS